MNENLEHTTVEELIGRMNGHCRFPVYMNTAFMNTDVDDLELSVRSRNCLKRAGYNTVGELVSNISGAEDIKRIRNCGDKSVHEIMRTLFFYTYLLLPKERRKEYMHEVERLNGCA